MQNIDTDYKREKNIDNICIHQIKKNNYNNRFNEVYIPKLEELISN